MLTCSGMNIPNAHLSENSGKYIHTYKHAAAVSMEISDPTSRHWTVLGAVNDVRLQACIGSFQSIKSLCKMLDEHWCATLVYHLQHPTAELLLQD